MVDNETLKYQYLNNFDTAMNKTESVYGWLNADPVSINIHIFYAKEED